MPTEAYSGYDGEVLNGTYDYQVSEWNLDLEITEVDTSTTADAGWQSAIGALKKASGTFRFFYQAPPRNPTGATSGLMVGSTPNLKFYVNKTLLATEFFSGNGLITKLSLKTSVPGAGEVTASFRNRGVWTTPS